MSTSNKFRTHKGVDIYVTSKGVFYADPIKNSSDFNDHAFQSKKLESVEKAIEQYEGNIATEDVFYYKILKYTATIEKLKLKSNVGRVLFFEKAGKLTNLSRCAVYDQSVEKTKEFKELENISKEVSKVANEEIKLRKRKTEAINRFKEVLKTMSTKPIN